MKLVLYALVAACAAPPPPPASAAPTPVEHRAAPAEEPPCPPPRRAIREGTAVLNASPDDLPGPPLAHPRHRAADVRGVPRGDAAFQLWRDGERWHLRATGPAGDVLQARVELVSDVVAEAPAAGLRVIHAPWQRPGRCVGEPPVADPSLVRAGFELTGDGAAHGIAFRAAGCFAVDVRRAGAPAALSLGESGTASGAVEICP